MKLSDLRETYYGYTGKLSDINRQIAFAGIAIIWVFKRGETDDIVLSQNFIMPAVLFATGLGFDILQYVYQSIVWSIFYRRRELTNDDEDFEFKAPVWMNITSWIFFGLKVVSVLLAYVLLIKHLVNTVIAV